ncbi:MAG: hypothetical protein WBC13_02315, partial [Dokdonella sp.]
WMNRSNVPTLLGKQMLDLEHGNLRMVPALVCAGPQSRSLRGRSHPAATTLPSIYRINRQAYMEPAMRAFRLTR